MNARTLGGLAALGLTTATLAATAENPPALEEAIDSPFSIEVSTDILSDYVWRGTICNDNPVWQPSVTLAYDAGDYGKLSGNVWSSLDLTHKRGTATNSRRSCGLQEIDYTLSYAVDLFDLGFEVGHIWYTFPNANGSSDQDLYATISYENDILTPSASLYWNYSDSAGTDISSVYASFTLSHEFTLEAVSEDLTLTPSASLGFGDNAYTDVGAELTDQTIGISAAYALSKNVSVGAQINYTWTPSHTLRHAGYMSEDKDQVVWGGVNLTLGF